MDNVLENLSPPSKIRSLNLASLPLMPVHSKSPTGETPSTATMRTLSTSSRTPAAAEAQRSKHGGIRFTQSQTSFQRRSPQVEPKRSAPGFLASRLCLAANISPNSSLRTMSLPLISRGGGGGGLIIKALHNLSHTQSGNIYHKNIENTSIFLYDVIHKSTQRA